MARNSLELLIPEAPFSINNSDNRKRKRWQETVMRAALQQWTSDGRSQGSLPLTADVDVVITTYFTKTALDVDNVIKPILDGLRVPDVMRNQKSLFGARPYLLSNDDLVYKVTSERLNLNIYTEFGQSTPPMVLTALGECSEMVHIIVSWEETEGA